MIKRSVVCVVFAVVLLFSACRFGFKIPVQEPSTIRSVELETLSFLEGEWKAEIDAPSLNFLVGDDKAEVVGTAKGYWAAMGDGWMMINIMSNRLGINLALTYDPDKKRYIGYGLGGLSLEGIYYGDWMDENKLALNNSEDLNGERATIYLVWTKLDGGGVKIRTSLEEGVGSAEKNIEIILSR